MQDDITDAEMVKLIEAAQKFENWAFDELYRLYANKLYRFILFKVGDQAEADDLLAEVFVRVLKKIKTFQGTTVAAFSGWIYRVAQNMVIDYYRRQGKRPVAPLEQAKMIVDEKNNPQRQAEKSQATQAVYEAITKLTQDQQQVILFKFFEGLGNAQIAKLLGKTEGSIKSLQHRALASLGRFLPPGVEL